MEREKIIIIIDAGGFRRLGFIINNERRSPRVQGGILYLEKRRNPVREQGSQAR